MKIEHFTDPFTGCDFVASKSGNSLTIPNVITNENMRFDIDDGLLKIPLKMFEHIETMTARETCSVLDISRQRLSQLVSADILRPIYIGVSQHFIVADVLRYKDNRKNGRPRKG